LKQVPAHPFILLSSLLLCLAGCGTARDGNSDTARPSKGIGELHLLAVPLAINSDQSPGADGFAVKVYAVDPTRPKTQPIGEGTLEILMFDGLIPGTFPGTNSPRHVWTYPAIQLPRYKHTGIVGDGYEFTPHWTTNQPKADQITVAARYRPLQGPPVLSAPSIITVVSQ